MAASSFQNPSSAVLKLIRIITGVQKNVVGKMTLLVAGVAMTSAQIIARLQTFLAGYQSVDDARKALASALAARRAQAPDERDFLAALDIGIKAQFGPRDPRLLDFGIKPRKVPAPKTAVEKALTAKKAQDSKAIKGTGRGRKQLSAITLSGSPGLQAVEPDGKPGAMLKAPVAPAKLPGAPTSEPAGTADGSGNAEGTGTPSGK